MLKIKNKEAKMPPIYPRVERKEPTVTDKGWDKVGNFTLRDKMDFMPQRGLQEKLCACESNLIFLAGAASMGKGMSMDAPILTPEGFKPLGDLSEGSVICGTDGGEQIIERVYEQGVKDMYRFVMKDGTSIESSVDHLWPISLSFVKKKSVETFLTTEEIVNYWNGRCHKYGPLSNIKFRLNKPVSFSPVDKMPISPYLLGLLIGGGGLTGGSVVFSTKDSELLDAFRQNGYSVTYRSGCDYTISGKEIIADLKKVGIFEHNAYDKFIPERYLLASVEEREELLRGLMDTDGGCNSRGGIVEYSTLSPILAKNMLFLARSLGYKARISSRTRECRSEALSYRIRLSRQDMTNAFGLQRKRERVKPYSNGRSHDEMHYLSSIEYTGKKECRCILVSNEDHLFIGEDFIVTHNTYSMLLKTLQGVDKAGFTARFISVRLQDSKKGSSIYRDAVEILGGFSNCEYNSSDYPTFAWPQWNSNLQLIHSNFNADNPSEWDEFKSYAKKNQASYIAIDEATEIRSFKMFSYWFSRNRDSSGMKPCMVLSFNPEHEHWTTQMLKDAGYIGDDWYLKPEMNGATRYFYLKGDTAESIVWGETPEEVADAVGIEISEKEKEAGITIYQIIKSFTFFTAEAADNKKLIAATGGQSIGNLHAVGGTQRSILHGAYFGPIDNDTLNVSRQMIHNLWENPQNNDDNMYGTLDVSMGQANSDNCPFIIWKGLTIIAVEFIRANPKELVEQIDIILGKYGIPVKNFAFDSTGCGYYLTAYTSGMPVTANKRPIQEIDENGNPVTMELYFNQRSQLLGKTKVLLEKGELSISLDKDTIIPYGGKGKTRRLLDVLFDEINIFRSTTRNARIYYRSKDEYKAKFHSSPDLMDAICLRSIFELDARPKKQPEVEVNDDAYDGFYNSYNGRSAVWV